MSFETRWPPFGIGTRLTLWGAALTALLCAGLSCGLYAGMFFSLRLQIDAFLEGELHEFMWTVNEHPNDDAGSAMALGKELGARSRHDLGFRLIGDNGAVLVTSAAKDPLRGLWAPPQGWEEEEPHVRCEALHPTGARYPYRVCSLRVRTADGRACTAQSSYLLDQMTESLATFRRIGGFVLLLAPLVALGVGGFLSRRSLQPIRRIMRSARGIGAQDLRSRIALSGTGDEMDQLAETLNGMLERIEKQVREIQRFTADASHELRTPLAALRGNAEVVLSRPRSADELRQTVEESIVQYERLQRIAEDLLLLARLDTGEAVIRRDPVPLDVAVADVVDLYAPMAEEKGLSLELKGSDRLRVIGDDGRLRQVIGNLLDNAIKYTRSPGWIRVSIEQADGQARVRVTDNGAGILAEDLPRVFDRFYRADPSRATFTANGSGLGLAICRSIVETHGGRIDLESSPNEGTVVTVILPNVQIA